MNYVYIKTEPQLWTVGFYDPAGAFHADSDHGTCDSAARRVCSLNGLAHGARAEQRCTIREHVGIESLILQPPFGKRPRLPDENLGQYAAYLAKQLDDLEARVAFCREVLKESCGVHGTAHEAGCYGGPICTCAFKSFNDRVSTAIATDEYAK